MFPEAKTSFALSQPNDPQSSSAAALDDPPCTRCYIRYLSLMRLQLESVNDDHCDNCRDCASGYGASTNDDCDEGFLNDGESEIFRAARYELSCP
jgi:hypothetical protein